MLFQDKISIISAVPTSSIKIRVGQKEFHQMLEIFFFGNLKDLHCLKLTAKAPENGWLEDHPFLLKGPYFQGRTVSFRECRKSIVTSCPMVQPMWLLLEIAVQNGQTNGNKNATQTGNLRGVLLLHSFLTVGNKHSRKLTSNLKKAP